MQLLRIGLILAAMMAGEVLRAAPATLPVAAGKAAPKVEEPPPAIEGVEIARPNGAFLGLRIVSGNFVLTFYTAEKEKKAPDVARAALRWPVRYQPSDERVVLNPGGDGTSLTSAKVIRPPHSFRVFISLFVEGSDDPVETHSVQFEQ